MPSVERKTPVYLLVTAELQTSLTSHGQYWWKTSGYLLAAFLHDAGYSLRSQHHILTFFGRTIVPYMGVAYNIHSPQWRSFMTDDHHPIELSWDWHTGRKPPTVRFSIEPVGINAGTPLDPENKQVDKSFREALKYAFPKTNLEWFYHFDRELTPKDTAGTGLMEGHPSKLFYAFDLTAEGVTSKAYFFPGFKARETNQTNFQVICDVIARAPQRSQNQLDALRVFEDFAYDKDTPSLEMDLLAIDMTPPADARLKIYFRSRDTSFGSVRQMMALGGRVAYPGLEFGLQNLRRLWDALLDQEGVAGDQPLPEETNHRTAGLLYNVEFRADSGQPKVKIYIPVRHYARSDERVISAVHRYMESVEGSKGGLRHIYADTMRRVFRRDALQQRGLHTYIGCSIQSGGDLRVVSYVNGQGQKMI
ncbi:aromatic prenyltransferase [Aspergillus crustosus]